jgi:hypothetical protein
MGSTKLQRVISVSNTTVEVLPPPVLANRAPLTTDYQYPNGQQWINYSVSPPIISEYTGKGIWIDISGTSAINTLEGNSGGFVSPDGSGNLHVIGDGTTATVVGNPTTNTLTISSGGSVATSYVEDTGSALPSIGILKILGGTGISTSGTGNTVTVSSNATVATSYVEDTGTAVPFSGILNILGASGVTTSGSGNTVTISPGSSIATSYVENTGSATPFSNVLNILGGTGILTSGTGNSITISSTSTGSPIQQVRTFLAGRFPLTINAQNIVNVPQSTDGAQIMSVAITPISSSSILEVRIIAQIGQTSGNYYNAILSIFRDSDTSASLASSCTSPESQIVLNGFIAANTTSPITIAARIGVNALYSGAQLAIIINGNLTAAYFGGGSVCNTCMSVTEWPS